MEHHGPGGHGGHGDHAARFRRLFWLNLVLALPVVIFSPAIQDWFGYDGPAFPGSTLVAPLFGSLVFFVGGWPFLTGGWSELRSPRPRLMLLIAMAITLAYRASPASELRVYYDDLLVEP